MKILLLDIETGPSLAHVWGIWQQNIGINQLMEDGEILCWAAKWLGDENILFDSHHKSSYRKLLSRIHKLVDEADAVVHYNGQKFDLPTLNREWLKHGFQPPSPPRQIDLLHVCKRQFRFISNKLDYVSQFLGLGSKVKHPGHELWTACMRGDKEAWGLMEEYNRQDVALLESLYFRLLPWIDRHPSHGAIKEVECCPKCGSESFQRRGFAITNIHKYPRYQCNDCGGWFRGNKTMLKTANQRFMNVAA